MKNKQDKKSVRNEILQGAAITLFTVIIMLILCEICVVLLLLNKNEEFAFKYIYQVRDKTGLVMYDKDLGWSNTPLYDKIWDWPNKTSIAEKINSLGLRDKEYSLKKPDSTYRIAIIGCSRTYGYAVSVNQAYSEVLEAMFEKNIHDKNIEVLNFGVNGYGLAQMTINYKKFVREFDPDLVILQLYMPNIFRVSQTEIWATQKPTFELSGKRLSYKNHPAPEKRFKPIETWLINNSVFYRFIKEKLLKIDFNEKKRMKKESGNNKRLHSTCTAILQLLKKWVQQDKTKLVAFTWGKDSDKIVPICKNAKVEVFVLENYENPKTWEKRGSLENAPPIYHWSVLGNRYVATAIYNYLENKRPAGLFEE